MDSSWFDEDDLTMGLSRRWASLASRSPGSVAGTVSHMSLLEESRGMELELQATSARLRETARMAVNGHSSLTGSGFTSRRFDLAQRINTIIRNTGDTPKCSNGENDELNKNFRVLKEENLKLKAVITDVTEVNKRWQKYNNDRQIYVQRLLSTIQDQQEQINKMLANRAQFTLGKPLAQEVENGALQNDVARLQRQIEQAKRENHETVEVLKFQVKAHHDDWAAERSEKQQALHDKLAADGKIRQLQKDVRALKLKLREERIESENRCSCCCAHACEPDQIGDISTPMARLNYCHNENTKTYRTSVHMPCNAGQLLSRGTTLSFGDDLTTDSDEKVDSQDKHTSDMDREKFPAIMMDERDELNENLDIDAARLSKRKSNISNKIQGVTNSAKNYASKKPWQEIGLDNNIGPPDVSQSYICSNQSKSCVPQSDSQPNLVNTSQLRCSVLHIPSPHSSSTVSLPSESTENDGGASGVTIGFNNNGLASVLSFAQTPIVKSFSLPNPKDSRSGQLTFIDREPSQSQRLPDLAWSGLPVTSPPETLTASAESLLTQNKPSKMSLLGAFAKSVKESQQLEASTQYGHKSDEANVVATKETSWKPKYFEDGIDTETREDIVCPVCDLLFPPTEHVKFLDHFGKCQSNELEQKLRRN